ncbi:MAG: HlyD family efflux transporter periplasmic adaptor subunit [Ignavibacteriales bacterium]|nr:MAG: HlyD family efflux transporter periplasmic adaptor subunit [Ignavibacteriales bacterium]
MKKLLVIASVITLLIGCEDNGDKEKIELSGTVETTNITLSSQLAGTVERIYQVEGNRVRVGDTLIIIDPETYILQLNQAEAQRDLAKSKYDLLNKGARSEDKSQAAEALNQAEASYQSAKTDFERIENLFENQSVTKKHYEDAKTRLTISEAQLNSAKQNLRKIENLARPEELDQAKAAFNAAVANVKLLQKRVNDCYVLSPINGQIVRNFVEMGETVNPQSSLVRVSNQSEVEVFVYIQETDLGKVKLGQKVEIFSDSYEGKAYEGKVTYISPEAEFTPKNIQTKEERTKLVFAVKIKVPNPNYELKSGMPVDAVIYF